MGLNDIDQIHSFHDITNADSGSHFLLKGELDNPAKIEFLDNSNGFQFKVISSHNAFSGRFDFDGAKYQPKPEWAHLNLNVHRCYITFRYYMGHWSVSFVHPRGTSRYIHPPICMI